MKFSRNPVTGEMEIYTDEGVYVGIMSTFGDSFLQEGADQSAEDGGPGSGNWGHKGRPGKRGGSGPGGGSQYRGGRSDIGYYGSRKDWLNGLSGDKQHEAAKFIGSKRLELKDKLDRKQKIEGLWEKGILTRDEADEALKKAGIKDIREDMSPEEYIMKNGDMKEKGKLLSLFADSRKWSENADRMIKENLSEDEQKVFDYMEENFSTLDDEGIETYLDLRAKAMDLPSSGREIPDEIQYAAGTKERPAPAGPDYGWWKPSRERRGYHASNMEHFMSIAAGGAPNYAHGYTKEEFEELNQKFLDTVAHGKMSPNNLSYYGIRAISGLRDTMAPDDGSGFKYTKEVFDRLSDDEKQQMLRIANYVAGDRFMDTYTDLSQMTSQEFADIETALRNGTPRSNKDKQIYRDYILMQEKMLTGAEPVSAESLAAKEAQKAAEAKERDKVGKAERDRQFAEEQKAFATSSMGQRKVEMKKKVAAFNPQTVRDAKTPEEVEKAFNDGGFFNDGYSCEAKASIPAEVYADAATAYKRVLDKYPFMVGELGGFGGPTNASGACCKEAYSPGMTEIKINPVDFKDPAEANRQRAGSVQRKWHPPVDEGHSAAECTTTHELGHSLANWLHRVTIGKFAVTKSTSRSLHYDNEVATTLRERTLKTLGISPAFGKQTYDQVKEGLSEYGASSIKNKGRDMVKTGTTADEFFAEAFCEGMLSSNPRPIAKEFMRQLDLFIQEHKITADTTALVSTCLPHLMNEGEERY